MEGKDFEVFVIVTQEMIPYNQFESIWNSVVKVNELNQAHTQDLGSTRAVGGGIVEKVWWGKNFGE